MTNENLHDIALLMCALRVRLTAAARAAPATFRLKTLDFDCAQLCLQELCTL